MKEKPEARAYPINLHGCGCYSQTVRLLFLSSFIIFIYFATLTRLGVLIVVTKESIITGLRVGRGDGSLDGYGQSCTLVDNSVILHPLVGELVVLEWNDVTRNPHTPG